MDQAAGIWPLLAMRCNAETVNLIRILAEA
jgi:hypothetical protein